ncbi:MAG: DUF1795 domain-containing protein [Limnobacter sp.]|nr:DUF1795 domain-containing protein [Limnobacter sp.]
MHYQLNEGLLELPESWQDESLNVIKSPVKDGINLVVSREQIPSGKTREAYLNEQVQAIRSELTGYAEKQFTTLEIEGQACPLLSYQWDSPDGPMHQINMMWARLPQLLSFTFTRAKPFTQEQTEQCIATLRAFSPAPAQAQATST